MYQAKELIKFTSKNLREIAKKKYVPSNNLTKSNKIIQLYQQDYSEEEIAKLLYNKTGKDQNFRKLKSRMIEKSAKSILLQMDNIKMRNKYDINIFLVQKLLLVSNLLLIKDNKNIAELLLKKAFRVALAVQFTPYIIHISRILRYFSAFNCDNVSFHYYDLALKNHLLIYL